MTSSQRASRNAMTKEKEEESERSILHASYLEENRGTKDLVRRLRAWVQLLQDDEEELPEKGLANCILPYLKHADSNVRRYTVLAGLEFLSIYAPEVPWEEDTALLDLFSQLTRQLANLANVTSSSPLLEEYQHMLQVLAHVRMGCLLAVDHVEALVDLVSTLLHSVRREHSAELRLQLIPQAVAASLWEYHPSSGGLPFPIPILDVLLLCLASGPTQTIRMPVAAPTGAQRFATQQVPHPTYHAAAQVIRSSLNRMAQPISQLLNGLLNAEAFYTDQSSLRGLLDEAQEPENTTPRKKTLDDDDESPADIYTICFELHRVAPSVLATVLGTLANGLRSGATPHRRAVTRCFGRLFMADPQVYTQQYATCFRDWRQRQHDVDPAIRRSLLRPAIALRRTAPESMTPLLVQLLAHDPAPEVRLAALRVVGAALAAAPTPDNDDTVLPLLQAMASRLRARIKAERRDALTALAHIYRQHHLQPLLQPILQSDAGEEERDAAARQILHAAPSDVYDWIPGKLLECVSYTDDAEMRTRVMATFDDTLFPGSSTTARAVGWTLVCSASAPSLPWLQQWWTQRAALQATTRRYLEARTHMRSGAVEADARARQWLEQVAQCAAPLECSKSSEKEAVLSALHGAKDQHIFRIWATLTDPAQAPAARARALKELPSRTAQLPGVADWMRQFVPRCAMGASMNALVLQECVRLAQACVQEEDVAAAAALLATVQLVVDIFPAIGTAAIFAELSNLLLQCRSVAGTFKKDMNESGIVTKLISILSTIAAVPCREGKSPLEPSEELMEELMQVCTHDGSPEQARNAVYTMARLIQGFDASSAFSLDDCCSPILQSLTMTSKFHLSTDARVGLKVVRALSSLSAIADCCPTVLTLSKKGASIFPFVLDVVLLGQEQNGPANESDDDSTSSETSIEPQPATRKHPRSTVSPRPKKNATPNFKGSLLESETVSVACRQLCAAVEFLVSYVRATTLLPLSPNATKDSSKAAAPPANQVRLLFQSLIRVLQNQGFPPSARDRHACSTRTDRAALRQCAAISLLRLCDTRLGLEQEMLTKSMWHTLAMSLLDEEKVVRVAIMEELSSFYKGTDSYGIYMSLPPKAPALRFLSMVALCCDSDRDHDVTPSHSANATRTVSSTKGAASNCVVNLRKVAEATYTHCCAIGKEAESQFENRVKLLITPEYCVPFAYHLLSHRRDTPSEEAFSEDAAMDEQDEDDLSDDQDHSVRIYDSQMRLLRKRLKVLFDSLILTLGDRANNISFLLRMTEIVGRHYVPVYTGITAMPESSPSRKRQSADSNASSIAIAPPEKPTFEQTRLVEARLKTICSTAREVLLSYVKSDINLTTYPGTIQLPLSLFRRSDLGTIRISKFTDDKADHVPSKGKKVERKSPLPFSDAKMGVSPRPNLKSSLGSSRSLSASKSDIRVTFSPDVQYPEGKTTGKISFASSSPVHSSDTPRSESSGRRSTRSNSTGSSAGPSIKTLGTTPPLDLPTGTAYDESDEEDSAAVKPQQSVWSKTAGVADRGEAMKNDLSSTTPNSEQSVLVTQTSENSDRRPSSSSSRESTLATHEEPSSHPRKRRALPAAAVKATKTTKPKQRSKSPPPKQIHVKFAGKRSKPSKLDEMDFPDENVPNARNSKKVPKAAKKAKSKVLAGRY